MIQLVKKLPAMPETRVQSLGWEDSLAKGTVTHSSILAWKIPWTVQSMGSQRVRRDWVTFTFFFQSVWNNRKEYPMYIKERIFPESILFFCICMKRGIVTILKDRELLFGNNSAIYVIKNATSLFLIIKTLRALDIVKVSL